MFTKQHLESFRDSLPEQDKRKSELDEAIPKVNWIKFGNEKTPESSQNLACTDSELGRHLQITRIQDYAEVAYAVVMKAAATGRRVNDVMDS